MKLTLQTVYYDLWKIFTIHLMSAVITDLC